MNAIGIVATRGRGAVRRMLLWMARNRTRTALVTGGVWAFLAVVRMTWPTPIGLADVGDGQPLMCQLGAAQGHVESPGAFWQPFWPAHRYYGEACGVPGTGETYWSSQLVLLRITAWLGSALSLPAGVDLRVLGVLCAVLVGLGVALWMLAMPASVPTHARLAVASVVGLIMIDSGIARFYASPYPEPAALLGIMLLCPAMLWLFRQRRYTWGALLAVAGVGAFTMLSKTQMIGLWPVLCVVLLLRPSSPPRWRHAHRGMWLRRLPALALVAALSVVAVAHLANQPRRSAEVGAYGELFGMILPLSENPVADLAWFDLDPALVTGSGTNISSPDSVAYEPSYAGFTDKVTPARVVLFYLTHPGRLGKLADTGMQGMAAYNTETYMASHPAGAGVPPFTTDSRVTVSSWLFSIYEDIPGLVMLHWLAMLGLFLYLVLRRRGTSGRRALALLGLTVMATLTVQFWTVLLTGGTHEISRNMVIADLLLLLTVPVALAVVVRRRSRNRRGNSKVVERDDKAVAMS